MRGSVRDNKPKFDTSLWYAPFNGCLIVPSLMSLLFFIWSIIMVVFVRTYELNGFDGAIYWMDVFNLVYLFITYLFWIARKKVLPILMIIFFIVMSIWIIVMYTYNEAANYFNLVASIIWIL